jgi:hypothetical protein
VRNFRQNQRGLLDRASRDRGKCSHQRGSSRAKGVVRWERCTLGERRQIEHVTPDGLFDRPSYFLGKSWVIEGSQQFLKVSVGSANENADLSKPCRRAGVALVHQFEQRFGFFLQAGFPQGLNARRIGIHQQGFRFRPTAALMNLFCKLHCRFRFAFGEEVAHFFLLRNWYACVRTANERMGQFGFPVVFHARSFPRFLSKRLS